MGSRRPIRPTGSCDSRGFRQPFRKVRVTCFGLRISQRRGSRAQLWVQVPVLSRSGVAGAPALGRDSEMAEKMRLTN